MISYRKLLHFRSNYESRIVVKQNHQANNPITYTLLKSASKKRKSVLCTHRFKGGQIKDTINHFSY